MLIEYFKVGVEIHHTIVPPSPLPKNKREWYLIRDEILSVNIALFWNVCAYYIVIRF